MSPNLKSSKEIVKNCKSSLDELKALNVCSFEVEEISSFTSFIIVASGTSAKCLIQLAYAIGVSKPLSVFIKLANGD